MRPQRTTSLLEKAASVYGSMAQIGGGPIQALSDTVNDLLLGPKMRTGPNAGKRLSRETLRPISEHEYNAMRRAGGNALIESARIKGHKMFFKRQYGHGGIVGLAKTHPVMALGGATAATALLASYVLSKRNQRKIKESTNAVPTKFQPQQAPPAWG
jgi:hypothetical protein